MAARGGFLHLTSCSGQYNIHRFEKGISEQLDETLLWSNRS